MAVTTEQVKQLREATGAGIMYCRRALEQTGGNLEEAREILRRQGLASVEKKKSREARQGLVDAYIHAGGRIGAMVEVNCETDFVARTDQFRTLARELAMQVAAMNPSRVGNEETDGQVSEDSVALLDQPWIRDPSKTIRDLVNETIAQVGENVVVRRFARFELGG